MGIADSMSGMASGRGGGIAQAVTPQPQAQEQDTGNPGETQLIANDDGTFTTICDGQEQMHATLDEALNCLKQYHGSDEEPDDTAPVQASGGQSLFDK